jgi:hypothetical protein
MQEGLHIEPGIVYVKGGQLFPKTIKTNGGPIHRVACIVNYSLLQH